MEVDAPLATSMFAGSKLVDEQQLARLDSLLHGRRPDPNALLADPGELPTSTDQ